MKTMGNENIFLVGLRRVDSQILEPSDLVYACRLNFDLIRSSRLPERFFFCLPKKKLSRHGVPATRAHKQLDVRVRRWLEWERFVGGF